MSELLAGDAFALSLLEADNTLMGLLAGGCHNEIAPRETPFPYLIMAENSASDRSAVGGYRLSTQSSKLFKVVDAREDFDSIGQAADLVDMILQRSHGRQVPIVSSGIKATVVLGIVRLAPFKNAYAIEGREYRELGGIYRVYVKADQSQG